MLTALNQTVYVSLVYSQLAAITFCEKGWDWKTESKATCLHRGYKVRQEEERGIVSSLLTAECVWLQDRAGKGFMGNSITCVQKLQDPERGKEQTYSQALEAVERETSFFFPLWDSRDLHRTYCNPRSHENAQD